MIQKIVHRLVVTTFVAFISIAAPTQTVPWVRDVGVGMVHTEEFLCFRSGVRPGKRHLQDVERG